MAFASALKIANSIVSAVATITSVSIMAFSGYMIYETQYVQGKAYGAQAIEYKPVVEDDTVSVEGLLDNIPDAVGWITMDGTHIDYPVVQGEDNLFYANHDVSVPDGIDLPAVPEPTGFFGNLLTAIRSSHG